MPMMVVEVADFYSNIQLIMCMYQPFEGSICHLLSALCILPSTANTLLFV